MPRAGLTPAVVARTAADLADENGWEPLTLAAVATRLGVRQPSLYKHVASLGALRRMVSLLAVTEMRAQLTDAVAGRSGAEALEHLADAYRAYAHAHPGRYAASVIAPADGDAEHVAVSDAILRTIGAVLRGYGLDDTSGGDGGYRGSGGDGMHRGDGVPAGTPRSAPGPAVSAGTPGPASLHAIRALRAMLHGFVALEAAGGFALALDLDESYRRMVAGLDAALRRQAAAAAPAAAVPVGAAPPADTRGDRNASADRTGSGMSNPVTAR